MPNSESISFYPREFKGSRLRCLLATHRPRRLVASFLTSLSDGHALVTEKDHWLPSGFLQPKEAKLGETAGFLNEEQRAAIAQWWLAKPARANTPNWDLVSTACVAGRSGLLIVEAKAHEDEFADDRCSAKDPANYDQIQRAIEETNIAWNQLVPGFALSTEHHYQLSNRFAYARKLALMKLPVVLVYLGFLNAEEMRGRKLLTSHDDWRKCVVTSAKDIVPEAVWDRRFEFDDTPVHVMIRSASIRIEATVVASDEESC